MSSAIAPEGIDSYGDKPNSTPYWRRISSVLFDTVAAHLAYDESLLTMERLPMPRDLGKHDIHHRTCTTSRYTVEDDPKPWPATTAARDVHGSVLCDRDTLLWASAGFPPAFPHEAP